MPMDARDVTKALSKKGFRQREGDHKYYHLYVAGKKTPIFTKVSHGEQEIGDPLVSGMAKQLKLSTGQFRSLVDCQLEESAYLDLLREQGQIE